MNENNLEYLKKSLDYLGFGTRLNEVLESAIRREMPKFSLGISQHYTPAGFRDLPVAVKDHMRFELNFSKSNESDMYFLNNYQAILSPHNQADSKRQVFDLERDHRINALQAYRLLSGFALEKEIVVKAGEGEQSPEKRSVWLKLNLSVTDAYDNHPIQRYYPEYGYELERSVDKYPFYLAGEGSREKFLKTLRNGGFAEAELMVEHKPLAVFVAAEPQYKTLNIFNRDLVKLSDELIFSKEGQITGRDQASSSQQEQTSGMERPAEDAQTPWKQEEQKASGSRPRR